MEMQQIVGGVSRDEYCEQLVKIMFRSMWDGDCENYERVDSAYNRYCK